MWYYSFAAIGICTGEILVLGEYVYDLIFEHIVVEVLYKKYPKNKRRAISSWSFAIPLLDEPKEDVEGRAENEMRLLTQKDESQP